MRPRLHDRLIIACGAFSFHRSLAYHSNRLIFAFGNNSLHCSGGAWLTFFLLDFSEPQRRQFFTVLRARRFSRVSSWLLLQSDTVNIVELVVYDLMQIFLSQPKKLSSPKKRQKNLATKNFTNANFILLEREVNESSACEHGKYFLPASGSVSSLRAMPFYY